MEDNNSVKALVEDIAKALVDVPNEVIVNEIDGEQVTVFELRVAQGDLGKVIGKQGRTARSIRTLLGAVGTKLNRRFNLEILE
ncbi:MAG: KH domain-containing protein [Bryobacteraceae bacterium]